MNWEKNASFYFSALRNGKYKDGKSWRFDFDMWIWATEQVELSCLFKDKKDNPIYLKRGYT